MEKSEISPWNLLSDYWDRRMGDEGDWYYKNIVHPAIFKLIGKLKGLKILDVGCGTGSLSRSLAKRGAIVVAVDHSLNMIEHAIRHEKEDPLNIRYYNFDMTHLSRNLHEVFDAVVVDFSMQDIENYEKVLGEIRGVISKGGKLVMSLEHPCFTIFDELHKTTEREWKGCRFRGGQGVEILWRYKNCKKVKIIWEKGSSTISYHRTLEQYSVALYNSGFLISRFLEPVVPISVASKGPKNNLSHEVPMFIVLEALPTFDTTQNRN